MRQKEEIKKEIESTTSNIVVEDSPNMEVSEIETDSGKVERTRVFLHNGGWSDSHKKK